MQNIVNQFQKALGSGPTPEDLARAEQDMLNDPTFPIPKDPKLLQTVIRCVAMGYVAKRKQEAASTGMPKLNEEQLRRQAIHRQIEHDRKVAASMVGARSIYSRVSLADPITKQTAVVRWLQDTFAKSRKKQCLLLGTTGAGKTYGAIGYISGIGDIHNVAFVRAYTLSQLVNDRDYNALKHYEKVRHLLVDDLGISQTGYKGEDFNNWFENMFAFRHEHGFITIMTSNATWDVINQALGERFTSRLREDGLVYVSPDADMRVA